jgi:hypothetical protein
MTVQRDAAEIAKQYLLWALEMIETAGNKIAAEHARKALEALREGGIELIEAKNPASPRQLDPRG